MSGDESGPPAARPRVAQRPHVVIISDDADLREFLGQGLLFAGFWTSAIASGIQAIEVFRLRGFDLIVIDAHIGGLPAVEIVRRLRGRGRDGRDREPVTRVPILVVDPPAGGSERDRLIEAGADEMLVPPLDVVDVAARLMTVVAEWREANPDHPWADAPAPQARGPLGDSGD